MKKYREVWEKILVVIMCLAMLAQNIMYVQAEETTVQYYFNVSIKEFTGTVTLSLKIEGKDEQESREVSSNTVFEVPVGNHVEIVCEVSGGNGNVYQNFYKVSEHVEETKSFDIVICGHENNQTRDEVVKEPTLYDTGKKIKYCENCNEQVGEEELAKLECTHTETEEVVVLPATEHEMGVADRVCKECQKVVETIELEKLPHTHSFEEITEEATCTSEGYVKKICRSCDYSEIISVIEKKEHSFNQVIKYEGATCTTEGVEIKRCETCTTDIVTVVPFSHSWNSETVTKEATCAETGIRTKTCSKCGAQKEEEIAKKSSHKWPSEYVVVKEATCTEEGEKVKYCSVCGEVVASISISKKGHDRSGEYVVVKEATCTEEGEKVKYCKVCGEIAYTTSISKNRHDYSDSEYVVVKEATCTEEGEKVKYCKVCGEVVTSVSIGKRSHAGEWIVTQQPTANQMGEKILYCTMCEEITETKKIHKTSCDIEGSEFYRWFSVLPTCTSAGYWKYGCEYCDYVISEEIIERSAHVHLTEEIVIEATETSTGVKKVTCEDCGYVCEVTIPMISQCEHGNQGIRDYNNTKWWYCYECKTYLSETIDYSSDYCKHHFHMGKDKIEHLAKVATETETGQVNKICSGCGVVVSTHEIPAHKVYTIDLGNGETEKVYGYFDEACSQEIFELLNVYRAECGVGTLKYASFLQEEANIRAIEASYYFNHTRPNGTKWYTLNPKYMNGENLAAGYPNAAYVMFGWKNSEGHDANLRRSIFKSVAISTFIELKFYNGSLIPTKRNVYAQTFSCYTSPEE